MVVVAMDDLSSDDEPTARLRALTHDLRGAIGALHHQTQLLADPALTSEVHDRSVQALQANIAELRRVLKNLEALTHASSGPA